MTTSSQDLSNLCSKLHIHLNGIYCKDQLRGKSFNDGGYILNLDNSTNKGTHWTACWVENNQCVYFDAFGIIYCDELLNWSKDKVIYYNCKQIQHITDLHCGYFCVLFLYFFQYQQQSNKMELFNNLFSSNTKANLKLLRKYFKQLIKINI